MPRLNVRAGVNKPADIVVLVVVRRTRVIIWHGLDVVVPLFRQPGAPPAIPVNEELVEAPFAFLYFRNVQHPGLPALHFSPAAAIETASAAQDYFLVFRCCVNYRGFFGSRILRAELQRPIEIISPATDDHPHRCWLRLAKCPNGLSRARDRSEGSVLRRRSGRPS